MWSRLSADCGEPGPVLLAGLGSCGEASVGTLGRGLDHTPGDGAQAATVLRDGEVAAEPHRRQELLGGRRVGGGSQRRDWAGDVCGAEWRPAPPPVPRPGRAPQAGRPGDRQSRPGCMSCRGRVSGPCGVRNSASVHQDGAVARGVIMISRTVRPPSSRASSSSDAATAVNGPSASHGFGRWRRTPSRSLAVGPGDPPASGATWCGRTRHRGRPARGSVHAGRSICSLNATADGADVGYHGFRSRARPWRGLAVETGSR